MVFSFLTLVTVFLTVFHSIYFVLSGKRRIYPYKSSIFAFSAAAKATPSPATYFPVRPSGYKKGVSLAYRWFDVEGKNIIYVILSK